MAVSNLAVFEVRPATGADLNSGGFVTTAGGTDYSQQTTAHVTFDGSTITATTSGTSATITITGYTVATTDKGNLLRIASGTNFTAGLYQITNVNVGANTWTLDRNCSAGAGSAMVGRMGGALATLVQFFADADANTLVPGGYIAWITGTYTVTVALAITVNYNNNGATSSTAVNMGGISVIGYTSARGDNGQFTMTTATNSVDLIHLGTNASCVLFQNANFTTTAGTVGYGVTPATAGSEPGKTTFINCKWTGFKRAIWMDGPNNGGFINPLHLYNCVVTGCTTDGIVVSGMTTLSNCYIYSNTGDGLRAENSTIPPSGILIVYRSVFYANTGYGIYNFNTVSGQRTGNNSTFLYNVACVSNTLDGFRWNVAGSNGCPFASIQNSIFYGNGGFGINGVVLYGGLAGASNAFGSNTSGPYGGSMLALPGDVSLSGDPFNGRTSNDFSLNSTAGAGAACTAAGFPGVLQLGGTGFANIGPLDPSAAGTTTIVVPNKTNYTFLGEGE